MGGVKEEDLDILSELIDELIEAIHMEDEYNLTPEDLSRALFGEPQYVEAVIARYDDEPAGFAVFMERYDIVSGKMLMSFELLYVRPAHRSHFVPVALLVYMLILARSRGYLAVEGLVHDWNTETLDLYQRLSAESLPLHPVRVTLDKVDWSFFRSLLGPEFANLS